MILMSFILTLSSFAADPSLEYEQRSRSFFIETGFRYRSIMLPDSLLDSAFYDFDDEGAYPQKRPVVGGQLMGFELSIKREYSSWQFYAEYVFSTMGAGYWDDNLDAIPDHEDGHWLRPDNLSAWFGGVNFNYEFPITPQARSLWLSIVTGGGLGAGMAQGDITYWVPGSVAETDTECYPNAPAYIRKDSCAPDGSKVGEYSLWPFVPMVDLTLSLKVNFAKRAMFRIDGGLHPLPYYGFATGGLF